MRFGSSTYEPSNEVCVLLLIRRSLVRAQVGEPRNIVALLVHFLQLANPQGLAFCIPGDSGDRHTFSPRADIDPFEPYVQDHSRKIRKRRIDGTSHRGLEHDPWHWLMLVVHTVIAISLAR